MKLFIILINIILAGSVVHAMEPADAAAEADARRAAFLAQMKEEDKVRRGDPFGDTDPSLRYNSTAEWAEIPAVKAEIDRLSDAAAQLKDLMETVKAFYVEKRGRLFIAGNKKRNGRLNLSIEFCIQLSERASELKTSKSVIEFTGEDVLKDVRHSFRSGYRTKSTGDIDTIVYNLNEFVCHNHDRAPFSMQDEEFRFSAVQKAEWGDKNGEAQAWFLAEEISASVKNIKKVLGIRSSFGYGFDDDSDDDSYLNTSDESKIEIVG